MSKLITLDGISQLARTFRNWVMTRMAENEEVVASSLTTIYGEMDKVKFTPITYSALKELRDNSQLVPGKQYRITDYVTTTTQVNTQSAGNQFDIIVTADDVNVLNENARAIQHTNDEIDYFHNSNLAAWELKYCLDNDTDRFKWADDSNNGKGVIYYMKDEWNNECPYDFKNIKFARWNRTNGVSYIYSNGWVENSVNSSMFCLNGYYNINSSYNTYLYGSNRIKVVYNLTSESKFYYTFGGISDKSFSGLHCNNVIKPNKEYINDVYRLMLNNIVFTGNDCINNIFGYDCKDNTLDGLCANNIFGNNCYGNILNSECCYNIFGNDCHDNIVGELSCNNLFGNDCYNIHLYGHSLNYNTFGNNCYNIYMGAGCSSNSFGNNCCFNYMGNYCNCNSFGNNSVVISFRLGNNILSELLNYCTHNHFSDGVKYLLIWSNKSTTSSTPLKNINVKEGVSGTDYYNPVAVNILGLNSTNEICVYNTNNGVGIDYGPNEHRISGATTLTYAYKTIILQTNSNFTIHLPSTPWIGADFTFIKLTGETNTISINGNGKTVFSVSTNNLTESTKGDLVSPGVSRVFWDPINSRWIRTYMG